MKSIRLSLLIPLYNEEELAAKNIRLYHEYLEGLACLEDFEIIAIDNASTDSTPRLLDELKTRCGKLRVHRTEKKGLGLALKAGLSASKYPVVMFSAIDICFGLDVIRSSIEKYLEGNKLILGSKGHKNSVYKANFKRKLFSKFYNFLLRGLFNTKIRDTQGTFLLNKDSNESVIKRLNSEGAWFQTGLVLYSDALHRSTVEIPVNYVAQGRPSKMRFKDALYVVKEMFKERRDYKAWVESKPFLESDA